MTLNDIHNVEKLLSEKLVHLLDIHKLKADLERDIDRLRHILAGVEMHKKQAAARLAPARPHETEQPSKPAGVDPTKDDTANKPV